MVTDSLFDVKNIDIWVPAYFKHNNLFTATVAGQQDSGPQANFPYHYLQHQDEASTTCCSISSHDLEEETNNKKIFTKTREENNFRWGRGPKHHCSTSTTTPILSSMLATEPSNFRQTGPVPPGTVIRVMSRF